VPVPASVATGSVTPRRVVSPAAKTAVFARMNAETASAV